VNEDPSNATDYVAAWITAHRSEIGGTQLKIFRQEQYGRTYCAEFETLKYLIQFCAWDHANCLDIQALDKGSGSDAYMVAGDCDGVEGLSDRLNTFLRWLDLNETNRRA
jgi:hypothetical protein